MKELLIAALDQVSAQRLAHYQRAMDQVHSLEELIDAAEDLYSEDVASGHITVLSEMIAASLSHPDLRPLITARMLPWIEVTQTAMRKATLNTLLEGVLASHDFGRAIVAFYVGMEMIQHLDEDHRQAESVFELSARLAPAVQALLGMDGKTPTADI